MGKEKDFYKNLEPFLDCKDYTVSGEVYQVKKHVGFDLLVTVPVPENIAKYYKSENYISHTDSKKSLLDKVYQIVKNITLKRKLNLINSFKTSSKNILDVGAGTGDFLKICRNNSWNVYGTEPSLDARNIAAKKAVILQEDLSKIKNQKFDVITLWHVLEHVEDLQDYISKLNHLLSEKGRLLIAVPNFKSDDSKYYQEHWAAFDVPRHLWHFSQSAMKVIFSKELSLHKIKPLVFDSFYVSLLSEKNKNGNTNFVKAFFIGLWSNISAWSSKEYSSLIYCYKNTK